MNTSPAASGCGCRSASTAGRSTSSSSATRRCTASCWSAALPPAPLREVEGLADAGQVGLSAEAAAAAPTHGWSAPGPDGISLLPPAAGRGVAGAGDAGHRRAGPRIHPQRTRAGAPARGRAASPSTGRSRSAFVRFSGTDELLRTAGPGRLAEALDECVRNVQEAADRHGVTFFETDIDQDGGKIMLVAGAPTQRRARTRSGCCSRPGWSSTGPGVLPLRVGVNSGPVFSGDFGPEFRRTYSVKGDAVNLAARVMGRAAPGQLLATTSALARSRTRFETEPLPPFTVKGKARPVEAASVGPAAPRGAGRARRRPAAGRARAGDGCPRPLPSSAPAAGRASSSSWPASRASASPGWSRS